MKSVKLFPVVLSALLAPALVCAQAQAPKQASPKTKKAAAGAKPAGQKAQKAEKPAAGPEANSAQDHIKETLKLLKSGNPVERRQAVERLGPARNPDGAPVILEALDDESPQVRQAAADALGLMAWRDAVPKLSALLLSDKDESVRQQCAIALSYMSDPAAGPALQKALKDASQPVRYSALHALGVLRYAPAEKDVIALLSSKDATERRGAISTLGMLRSADAGAAITVLLGDPDPYVRTQAVRAIGEIGHAPAAPELVKLLAPEGSPQLRVEAAYALAQMGKADGLPTAYEFSKSPEMSVRSQALKVITAAGDERSLKFLEELYAAEQNPVFKNMLDYARQRLGVRLSQKAQ